MNYFDNFVAKLPADGETITQHATHAPPGAIIVPDAHLLFNGDFKRSGVDLILSKDDHELVLQDYFKGEKRAALSSPDGAHLTGDIVNALTGHTQYAQADGSASVGKVIGHVTKLVGAATAVRNGVSIVLNVGDNVEKGDVVQAGSDSRLGITFIDGTVFGLSSNAKMVLNEMVYDPNGSNNSSLLSLVQGTITFVAGETAKHGDMKVDTPVATMGIRGTAVLVEIDFVIPGALPVPNAPPPPPTANFQVLVEPDGTTGSYILFDKTTLAPLATVNLAGTQTSINGQGVVNFMASAPLSADAQKLITDVFTQRFTDNSDSKTTTAQNDTITPQSGSLIKLANGDSVVPTLFVLNLVDKSSASSDSNSNLFVPFISLPPDVVTVGSSAIERPGVSHSSAIDTVSGTVNFTDINATAIPTVTATFNTFTLQNAQHSDITATLTAQQLAAIAAVEVPISVVPASGNNNNGSATLTYSMADGAFDFLAANETLTLIYAVTINDGHGGVVSSPFSVTITGTNDSPVITSETLNGAVTQHGSTGNLSDSGAISFADVDLSDVHLVSATGTPIGTALGTLTVVKDSDTTGTGTGGHLTWTYTVADSAVAYLTAGQIKVESFMITLDDQHGGLISKEITVTINGSNDTAVIGGVSTGAVTEDVNVVADKLSTGGALTITDPDQGQANFVVQPGVAGNHGYGTFTLDAAGHWTYTADDGQSAIQQLGLGQSITDSFTAVSSDGSASQLVTVTINGSNDTAVIGGVSTGAVTEDVNVVADKLSAGGALTITDPDQGQASFVVQPSIAGNHGYGTFTLDAAGHWTYTADDGQSAIQQLGLGQSITDSFTAVSSDGSASQLVTVTINGSNDAAVIGGVSTGAVTEDVNVVADKLSTGGALTITDPDQGQANFVVQPGIAGNHGYGTFTLDAAGHWTYTADDGQSAIQQLDAGQSITDSFTAVSSDGSASQLVTVTINGSNDTAVIGGVSTGAVTEDVNVVADRLSTGGALTITDPDQGQASFVVQPGIAGNHGYGTFTLDAAGHWTYTADDGQSAIQQLGLGQSITDSFTAVSSDGSASQLVTVTINGSNDTAVIGGVSTGAVTEDVNVVADKLSTGGALTITDPDQGQASFVVQPSIAGNHGYGTFTLDAAGHWTYTADDGQSAIQQLGLGQSITDSFTAVSSDGSASQLVTVTINGSNDAAVISGTSSGTVVEAGGVNNGTLGTPTATGTLTDVDVDNPNNTFTAVTTATASTGGYGTYQMTAAGVWTYTLNNSNTTVQALNASQHLTDAFTVRTIDGTAQVVTVTINGTNDAAIISGKSSGNVEIPDDGPGSGKVTDTGTLTDTDVDNTPNTFIAAAAGSATDHGYGTYQMTAAGVWTYTLNYSNPTVRGLNEHQHVTDTFTVHTVDGTAKVVTVTVSDDDPVSGSVGPAGVAGSEINLGLAAAPPDPGSLVTATVADLPSGWSLTGGVQVDDHTWTIQTSDVQSLAVIPSSASLGAVVLEVSESWTKPDGGLASAMVVDNVESYAVGSPIFALAANDYLSGSSGPDLFVFAQPISHDVVYSFNSASDKIDLVGFSGFADFNDVAAHLSDDGAGNTVLTLASDETITLHGVNSASLNAGNFEFNQQTVLENSANMIIGNGAALPLGGMIENTGVIELNSTGGETDLQLIQSGATLHGGGQIVLSDSDANIISGTSSGITLNNEDNTISGAGLLGNGELSLTNAGTINATGTHVLNIDTGSNIVLNSGVLEASGSGGMTVASAIANSGILWANGATLTVQGAVSGNGTSTIDGTGTLDFEAPSTANVVFGSGAAGTLRLGDSFHFNGTIAGFEGSDVIELANMGSASASISYHENAAGTGGTLAISDGAQTVELSLLGHYTADSFSIIPNHVHGTLVTYVPHDLVV